MSSGLLTRARQASWALALLGLVAAACGGATAPAASAPAGGAASCGLPVKAKCPDEASALTGAGATFPAVIYTKWVEEYNKLTGIQINYQAVGSGGGIKSITDGTTDYGASDGPMTDDQLKAATKGAILHVPMVLGAVVPTYNLPNVTTSLKFTSEALAGIFLGEIKKWNDPKLVAANPGVTLPDLNITTVHRSDGSGTTYIFTDYLSKVSAKWKSNVGFGTSVNWPGGVGASGNAGVAGAVKQTPGSIGYVELIYAIQQKLGAGLVENAKGKFVEASLDSTSKAADGVAIPADFRASITNSDNPDAYPISGFTWTLTYKEIPSRARGLALARFFWWSTHEGQAFAKDLGYAPLPASLVTKVEDALRALTSGGQPLLPRT